jgi:hypothetical protein
LEEPKILAIVADLQFESAVIDWRIVVAIDGKIAGVSFIKKP